MKHPILQTVYTGAAIALCLLPSAGMLLADPVQPAANQLLAPAPHLRNADGSLNAALLSDVTDYMADHFAFRQELVTAWAGLNAALGTSTQEDILLGADGWLYFRDTLDDYMGRGMTDTELTMAAENLALMQESVIARGGQFLFTIAPNKNSLYPDNMPDYIPHQPETSNAARLPAALAEAGVAYADLFSPFRARPEPLYFSTDSHWTHRGAALAADTLLTALGRESHWFSGSFPVETPHKGDLYEMLYPAGTATESDALPEWDFTYDSDPNGGNAITISTQSAAGTGTLLCFRDSFGIALHPYLAQSFQTARFSRQTAYDLTQSDSDVVLIELVERNLDQLIKIPGVFPAPERPRPETQSPTETVPIRVQTGQTAGTAALQLVTGTLTGADGAEPVYLAAGDTCYACTRLTGALPGELDFAAWLPIDAGTELTVISRTGETWQAFSGSVES